MEKQRKPYKGLKIVGGIAVALGCGLSFVSEAVRRDIGTAFFMARYTYNNTSSGLNERPLEQGARLPKNYVERELPEGIYSPNKDFDRDGDNDGLDCLAWAESLNDIDSNGVENSYLAKAE